MPENYGITTPLNTQRPQLLSGTMHIAYKITLAENAGELKRGTVLARVTADDEYVPLNPTGTGGAQTALAILADDVTVGATPVVAEAYGFGQFIEQGLVLPTLTPAQRAATLHSLRTVGIFVTTAH
jgi:hypothetical protein